MKRLLMVLGFTTLAGTVYAAGGGQTSLTVSSGTYQPISTYINDDGANRQAIIIGARTSSATLSVDNINGIPVYLSTGSTNNVLTNGVGTVNIISTNTLPVSGTFFQTNQPVTVSTGGVTATQGTAAYNIVSTNTLPVSGTFFQTNQPVTITTGGVTISGSISNTGFNVNNTPSVNGGGFGSFTITPGTGTFPISGVPLSLTATVTPGTGTFPVSGSLSANSVNITTSPFNGPIPQALSIVGGLNPSGLAQTFAVDASSNLRVNVTISTNPIPAGSNTIGGITGIPLSLTATVTPGTGTFPVSGSLSANSVNITTTSFNGSMPQALSIVGGINPSGLGQTFAVDASSNLRVNVTLSTNPIPAGTNTIGSVNGAGFGSFTVTPGTGTFPVSGSLSANSVNITTSAFNGPIPQALSVVGGLNPSGLVQTFAVDASSNLRVNVTLSSNPIPAGTNTIGSVNGGGFGSFTVTPGTGTWPTSGSSLAMSATVTPGTGTWATSGSALLNNATVTPGTGTFAVSGTFFQTTQPISATPLQATVTVTPGTGTMSVQGTLSENGAANTTNRVAVLPAIYEGVNANTLGTSGRDAAIRVGTKDGSARFTPGVDITRYSYSASTNNFSIASTPTDITALCGSSQATLLIRRLAISCTQTTAGIVQASVIKYSTKFTGAWSTMTVTSEDSNYGLVTSTAVWFTANPTRGTEVGHLDDSFFGILAPGTASDDGFYQSPSSWLTKPIVLRGTNQCVAFNLEGVTASGGKCSVAWQWMEDSTL